MIDYRDKSDRTHYFHALYDVTLKHGIMPGLVYLYMPALKHARNWDAEQALWFAFLNGMTQNPLTSLLLMEQLPSCPSPKDDISAFESWFNAQWPNLFFDTDRLKNKRNTEAVEVAPGTLVSARVLEHKPAALQPLEAVRGAAKEIA